MEVYQTEEEQIEAIKKWWNDNGTSVVVGVCVALAAFFGWQSWQKHESEVAEGASVSYQSLIDAVKNAESAGAGDVEDSTVSHLGSKVLEEHAGTTYSQLSALLLAKYAVEKDDLEDAANKLQWAIEHTNDESIRMVAKVRLAKVLLAQDKADEALKILNSEKVEAFEATVEELKGDIYLSKNDKDQARRAYEQASVAAKKTKARRPMLDLKMNDISVPGS